MQSKQVYFDNAASTPVHPKVLEKMLPYLKEEFGNPSSVHSFGRKTRVAIEEAREIIADFINANPSEIYFTSGGTESNNFSLVGIAKSELNESGRNKIIATKAEHHCVLETLTDLNKNGFSSKIIDIEPDSSYNISALESSIKSDVSLISVIHANNETGAVNNIKVASEIAHRNNSYFHSDAVQSFGKIRIDVNELGADSLSFSSHKINGPKGAGAVFTKSGTPFSPIIFGGSQERNRRGGTENVAAIIGFAEAVKICNVEMESNFIYISSLKEKFIEGIRNIDKEGISINSAKESIPHIVNITFKGDQYNNDAESILMYLDINGIAVSNGAACTSGTLKPSHVILAMGKSVEDANGTIRFSFGAQNTFEEVDYALEILEKRAGRCIKTGFKIKY